jgi:hypothetical protein
LHAHLKRAEVLPQQHDRLGAVCQSCLEASLGLAVVALALVTRRPCHVQQR